MPRYISCLESTNRARLGGKAAGLGALVSLGVRVPRTYIVSAQAKARYDSARGRDGVVSQLERELSLLDLSKRNGLAVRSSAANEDGTHESLAGRYESHLHVRGVERVLEAIQSVWESGGGGSSEQMQVLIQDMVVPTASGASFSRDPLTGSDTVVVEAVEGTSERLLQGGVTPLRWTIGDEEASSDWERLPTKVLREIAKITRHVAKELHYPADLEWAFDGEAIWWLQVRPITSLRGLPVYSNRISREYLPGLVKPLVWSVNVPMINGAWVDLFEQIVGRLAIDPLALARQFHYRAYFNMSGMGQLFRKLGLPEDALEQVIGLVASTGPSPFGFRWRMIRHLPRVLRFAGGLLLFHPRVPRWERTMLRRLIREEKGLGRVCDLAEALRWVEGFLPLMRAVSRQRIVSLLLHLTVGQLAQRALRKNSLEGSGRLESEDPRLEAYDPVAGMRSLSCALHELPVGERDKLDQPDVDMAEVSQLLEQGTWSNVKRALDSFVERFGHVGESGNDFSSASWSENPISLLRVAANASDSVSQMSEDPRSESVARRWGRRLAKRRLDRERVGVVSSRGFHLLRTWALRCGSFLVALGALDYREDVFSLPLDELREFGAGRVDAKTLAASAAEHRSAMEAAKTLRLPETIIGDYVVDLGPAELREANALRGIGTSRGVFEGTARAIRSMDDFGSLRDEEVLVVPFSDMAWTPLFARAGAVVAEAGGLLSHSSIVARETGIPAVVSVSNACALLDGRQVRVDGLQGTVKLLS